MTGTWLCSLCLFMSLGLGAASLRSHEIQLRNNNYAQAPDQTLLQSNGFTKVIVRVFSDDEKNGGLYFINPKFKAVRPVLDNWAPEFLRGEVSFWAWMGGRYFSWMKDSPYLDREWRNGQKRVIPKLDLFNPEAEQLLVSLFRELAQKPIRGILIQDDLVLGRSEGFSNWGKACFTMATGLPAEEHLMSLPNSAQSRAWERVKCGRLVQVLEKIVMACKAVNPQLKIAMNIHYELPLAPTESRSWYAHDAPALAASSLDYLYLMAYHRQIKSELGLSETANRLYFVKMAAAALESFGPKLVLKLQVRDWQTSALIPLAELKTYYDLIPAGVEHVCFAAADPEDIPDLARIFGK